MVIKLVKNEIKETFKTFLPVFILSIIGGVLTFMVALRLKNTSMLTVEHDSQFLNVLMGMAMLAISALVIATVVLTAIQAIKVAYASLYKMNGYRMFTYPVSSLQLYLSKLITIVFWVTVSSIVAFLAYVIPLFIVLNDVFFLEELNMVWGIFKTILFGSSDQLFATILMIISQLSSTLLQITLLMLAGSIANSSYVRKNRGFMTFLIFLGLYLVFGFINGMIVPEVATFEEVMYGNAGFIDTSTLSISILTDAIFVITCSAGTIWMWNNKLEVLN